MAGIRFVKVDSLAHSPNGYSSQMVGRDGVPVPTCSDLPIVPAIIGVDRDILVNEGLQPAMDNGLFTPLPVSVRNVALSAGKCVGDLCPSPVNPSPIDPSPTPVDPGPAPAPVNPTPAPGPITLGMKTFARLPGVKYANDMVVSGNRAFVLGKNGTANPCELTTIDLQSGAIGKLALPPVADIRHILNLAVSPSKPNVMAMSLAEGPSENRRLFVSDDGGQNWRESIVPGADPVAAFPWRSVLFQPGSEAGGAGVLWASHGCDGLVASADLGQTWKELVPASTFGIQFVRTLSADGTSLFMGGEMPMDIAWVEQLDVSKRAATTALPKRVADVAELGNHNPNVLVPDGRGGVLIGAELCLARIGADGKFEYMLGQAGGGNETIFSHMAAGVATRQPRPSTAAPTQADGTNAYVNSIVVDPQNPDVVVFGGSGQVPGFFLYVSTEGGKNPTAIPANIDGLDTDELVVAAAHLVPGTREIVMLVTNSRPDFQNPGADSRIMRFTLPAANAN